MSFKTVFKSVVLAAVAVSSTNLLATDYMISRTLGGFKFTGDGVELSMHSQVIGHTPEWYTFLYTMRDEFDVVVAEDHQSAEFIHSGENERMELIEYIAKVEDDSIIIDMQSRLKIDAKVDLEYTMLMPPTRLLAGSTYVATTLDGRTIEGEIPEEYTKTTVTNYFKNAVKAVFTSDLGTYTVEVLDGVPFNLGDRRYNAFETLHGFWIGGMGPFRQDEIVTHKLKVTFEKSDDLKLPTVSSKDSGSATLIPAKDLVIDMPERKHELIPYPQEITKPSVASYYVIPANATISISVDADEKDRLFAAANRVLNEQANIAIQTTEKANGNVKIYVADRADGLVAPENEEGYALKVTLNGVTIVGKTPRACFYGIQTLRNLYDPDKKAFEVCQIVDYPDLEYRGAMFLIDDYSIIAHKYMIENMLAPMKMNEIIMECEYAKWDAIPNLHQPHAISKEDIVELIKIANDNYMDVSPLFQTLGHCEWLFYNGQNQDMMEDITKPYVYNVSHPDLYPLMDSILDEIVVTFNNPKYLHIGHDEVVASSVDVYPVRPENKEKGIINVIYDDIMHYYDYANKHNMQVMMWHDLLMTREECPENGGGGIEPHMTVRLRPMLPRDIIIVDWRYSGAFATYPDVEILRNEGFEVIGATWYDVGNHEHLTPEVKKYGGMGMLQTVWNGYFGNKEVFEGGFVQIAAYTRTGSWAWNAKASANNYDSPKLASYFYEDLKGLLEPSNGTMLDLSDVVNLEISAENNPFLYKDTYGIDQALKVGVNRIGQVDFELAGKDGKLQTIALKSDLLPKAPATITIETDELKANKLFLLHTALTTSFNKPYGVVTLNYADGTSAETNINYNWDIATLSSVYNFYLNTANSIEMGDNKIWYMTLVNPNPTKVITSIEIDAKGNTYYLFGISASN